MELHCWGISHKSTSLEVREKFAFNKKEIDEVLTNLKITNTFDNGILLSTCNRTELYLLGKAGISKDIFKDVSDLLNCCRGSGVGGTQKTELLRSVTTVCS